MSVPNPSANARKFEKPVKWLLGRELLAGLKYIAAYSFMGDKFDARDWMQAKHGEEAPNIDQFPPGSTYWFDFIADTGDGMLAVYNIAQLCQRDLWLDTNAAPGSTDAVALAADGHHPGKLPRGEFLFVGGDIAYHIADVASLKQRFQTPFNWAYDDLTQAGHTVDKRPIYAIPANHDYYDALDGFNRQFRKPFGTTDGQIPLKGFKSKQEASYVALKLPFDWHLWGFDSQNGEMDLRQQDFFKNCSPQIPDKLIIVTPEPITVFGKWQSDKAEIVKTFNDLKLPTNFLPNQENLLPKTQCRLDLSGDIHHYERYWATPKTPNYASVVAGGGGAFLHPSHTRLDEVEQQQIYPPRLASHRLSINSLLNPIAIFNGGFVWLAGALVGLLSYFAVAVPQSTWSLLELLDDNKRPDKTQAQGWFDPVLVRIQQVLNVDIASDAGMAAGDLGYILFYIALLIVWILCLHNFGKRDEHKRLTQPSSFRWIAHLQTLLDKLDWDQQRWLLVSSALLAALPLGIWIMQERTQTPHPFWSSVLVELFAVAAILLLVLNRKYSDLLNERAKAKQKDNASLNDLDLDENEIDQFTALPLYPLWIIAGLLAPLFAGYGFLHYGTYSASIITCNLLIGLVWVLILAGLPGLSYFVGGNLLRSKEEAQQYKVTYQNKNVFWLIGIWHALLQIATPVCLALYGSGWRIILFTLIALAATEIARRHFSSDKTTGNDTDLPNQRHLGWQLLGAWGVLGGSVLLAAISGEQMPATQERIFAATMLGIVFSCLWFGWYLAVSLAFNGHNNEAGGGARSEGYRHMIRFAVQEKSLTGYVIGIDTPYRAEEFNAGKPKFRLVDKFTIGI